MSRFLTSTLSVWLIVALLGPLVLSSTQATAQETMSVLEKQVLDLVNQTRAEHKLAPLRPVSKLFAAARAHSKNMAEQGKMDHVLDGKDPGDRLRVVGYQGFKWGENVAWNQRTAEQVMNDWLNSPGHRANILDPDYTEIGIGIGRQEGTGSLYWTQVFGRSFGSGDFLRPPEARVPIAPRPPEPKAPVTNTQIPAAKTPPADRVAFSHLYGVSASSPVDPRRPGRYMAIFELPLNAGQRYVLDLVSNDVNAYLRLEKDGQVLAQDDDSAGNRNARIRFTPPQSGMYTFVLTTATAGETGILRLTGYYD